ncbi:PREDICTED: alkaline phosphatase-like [Priapulus caudatus]|uniref:Alkaline phosphatase n=1 Tax=Priapulus caudatus TaxID=37621 RepID=A0ABM1DUC8_PRICU|nr:PREDICTED: alkaline phosphatase-like [Priapulus caudatus]
MIQLFRLTLCLTSFWLAFAQDAPPYTKMNYDRAAWNRYGQEYLDKMIEFEPNTNVAKNMILFIGDGMGLPSVTAGRIYKGQRKGKAGEDEKLDWENFPFTALSKTYNWDRQIADSAGSATAYLSGVKANYYTIGVDGSAVLKRCDTVERSKVDSILKWAQDEGKSVGFVTTARATHASPGPLYAHAAYRYWENDAEMMKGVDDDASSCKDIARQLVEDDPGRKIQVILAGGRSNFRSQSIADEEYPDKRGNRLDRRNLIEDWLSQKEDLPSRAKYVWNKKGLDQVSSASTDYLLGLFEPSHMLYELNADPQREPTLEAMAAKAIEILSKNPKGYFLFVESSNLDLAHHEGFAKHALMGVLALDDAVTRARKMTSDSDTLIVVTADHSHAFGFYGYPERGSDIFKFTDKVSDVDFMPYQTIIYSNGPGWKHDPNTSSGRPNLTETDTNVPSACGPSRICS